MMNPKIPTMVKVKIPTMVKAKTPTMVKARRIKTVKGFIQYLMIINMINNLTNNKV